MAKMSTPHHMFTSPHSVSSSAVIARMSVQSQTPVLEDPASSSGKPVPNAYNNVYQFDGKMAIAILVLASLFLLLCVFVYYVKKLRFAPPAIPALQPAMDRRPGQKNEGLNREAIETSLIVAYYAVSMAKNCTACTVCLMGFREGEEIRQLPKCNHAFHSECIDMWLSSHSTCPLCRMNLISESHTITIHSNPSQESTRQENSDGAAPVIE